MTDPVLSHVIRVADLPAGRPTAVDLTLTQAQADGLARALDLIATRKVALRGRLSPLGRKDWQFEGTLGATVVQPCVVTLDPVTTRIDTPVLRTWIMGYTLPQNPGETEMDEDDTIEALTPEIDLGTVLTEALVLALPDYPRSDPEIAGDIQIAAPGAAPLTDDDVKPFAQLAALRDKLAPRNDKADDDAD